MDREWRSSATPPGSTYFGARPDIVGQSATLDGTPSTIIGVLPSSFHFAPARPSRVLGAVSGRRPSAETNRGCHNLLGVARLKDGVSIDDARAQMSAIAARLEREYPDSNRDQSALSARSRTQIVGDIRPILLLLLSGAGAAAGIAWSTSSACCWCGRRGASASSPSGARSAPRTAGCSPVRDRSLRARGARRRRRPRRGRRRHPAALRPHVRGHARAHAVSRCGRPELARGLRCRLVALGALLIFTLAPAVRVRFGAARGPGRRLPRLVGQRVAATGVQARGLRAGDGDGHAGRRGPARPEPLSAAARRPRVRSRRARHDPGGRAGCRGSSRPTPPSARRAAGRGVMPVPGIRSAGLVDLSCR